MWRREGNLGKKNDEGASRESSAVHLLAPGGNTVTLALPLPTSLLQCHFTCTIYDPQGRPRVSKCEDVRDSSGCVEMCVEVEENLFGKNGYFTGTTWDKGQKGFLSLIERKDMK
ncbi:hypothetical protein XENOCAPTIV_018548 [Xenoophorus captivus]|uniref:Uncharacterized protein n=1 Tax=Xenoophorus captivus TaxID=1517983 RepID=A0ABV0RCQ9_9TELE